MELEIRVLRRLSTADWQCQSAVRSTAVNHTRIPCQHPVSTCEISIRHHQPVNAGKRQVTGVKR